MTTNDTQTAAAAPPAMPRVGALVPPWALVVISVVSVQIGAATAKQLFETAGPPGVVFLRVLLTAAVFVALWRPSLRLVSRRQAALVALFGTNIAAMMLVFYASIELIPLGVSVAISFAGPLGLAVVGSRRAVDILWVCLAGAGVLLLTPLANAGLNPVGIVLAFGSAASWASYIVLSRKVNETIEGNAGLALGMCVAALVALPVGLEGAARVLLNPSLLGVSLIVVVMSAVIPFTFEFEALKRLRMGLFGLLLSLEPVAAVVIGFVVLHEALGPREIAGILMVTVAAAATARSG